MHPNQITQRIQSRQQTKFHAQILFMKPIVAIRYVAISLSFQWFGVAVVWWFAVRWWYGSLLCVGGWLSGQLAGG
jgi:hypothetical protein